MRKTKGKKAAVLVIASAMLWGTYGSFLTAITARGMSANVVNFLRFASTSLPILAYLLAKDRTALRVKKKDLWLFAANGLASILFFTACYAAAIRETKIATAAAYLAIAFADGTAAQIVRLPGATLLSVVCGLFTGLLAYLFYTAGLRELEPSRAAQLATIEPVFAALLGVVLFRQRLSPTEILGVALVVAAVVGTLGKERGGLISPAGACA